MTVDLGESHPRILLEVNYWQVLTPLYRILMSRLRLKMADTVEIFLPDMTGVQRVKKADFGNGLDFIHH